MKRSILMAALLALGLTACGNQAPPPPPPKPPEPAKVPAPPVPPVPTPDASKAEPAKDAAAPAPGDAMKKDEMKK